MREAFRCAIGILGVIGMFMGLLVTFFAAGAADANYDGWLWMGVTGGAMMVIGLGITGWMLDSEEDE